MTSSGGDTLELQLIAILLVAAMVAIAAARIRIPYIVALVVAGLLVGFAPIAHFELSRELILEVLLPPLLFDAALNMDLAQLRRRWLQIAVLAVPGTLLTAAAVALGLSLLTGIDLRYAVLMGVMLAPTDPVSVLATFKEHRVVSGLRTLVEGESIFNDGLGVVLVVIAVSYVFPDAGPAHNANPAIQLGVEIGVGTGVGLLGGWIAHRLMRTIDDHFVEITLSITVAFATSLIANRLGGSGLLATVGAGLFLGNYQPDAAQSSRSQEDLLLFWEVIAFLLNSMVFVMVGMQPGVRLAVGDRGTIIAILVATGALLVGRALLVYGLLQPFRKVTGDRIPTAWLHAIFWGGLRGTIPVALVLGLSPAQRQFGPVNGVGVVFGVVLLSVIAQGLTFGPLLRRAGLIAET